MSGKDKNLHDGHRERVREKYMADGSLEGYAPHNILELLLFYALPRGNTNELAHKLINRFGCLSAVLDASVTELMKVDGVGKSTAVFLSMLPGVFKEYSKDKADFRGIAEDGQIGEYICSRFLGETVERVLLVCLDNRLNVLGTEFISDGFVDYTTVDVRAMLDSVIRHKATAAIIAHNHPRGYAFPSQEDLDATVSIRKALEIVNVRLIDHLIVANDDYVSLASSSKFRSIFD